MYWTTVPEAPIYENRNPLAGEGYVGPDDSAGGQPYRVIFAESKATSV